MGRGGHRVGALAIFCSLALAQGCYGPMPAKAGQIAPGNQIWLSRREGFTLNHYAGTATDRVLECSVTRAQGRVVSVTAEHIIVRDVVLSGIGRTGDCGLAGTAWVVLANVPGLRVDAHAPSPVRTAGFIFVIVPLIAATVLITIVIVACVLQPCMA